MLLGCGCVGWSVETAEVDVILLQRFVPDELTLTYCEDEGGEKKQTVNGDRIPPDDFIFPNVTRDFCALSQSYKSRSPSRSHLPTKTLATEGWDTQGER